MYLVQLKGQYRLREIAEYFGLTYYGDVASSISAVKAELESSRKVSIQINNIINRLDP